MRLSRRLEKLPPYLFVEISRKIAEKRARGEEVITFGIGDPDLPTPDHVLLALIKASLEPANHRYPETEGLPAFRQAVAEWYHQRFGVELDPEREVVSLIGAKEGVGHAALCFIDPGDLALVPDPAYPVYASGVLFAGGECYRMPLKEENGWLPDLEAIPPEVARSARVMWLNYPNNPTGAVAPLEFLERAVHFARRHGLALLHDCPYSEVAYDGYRPHSILEVPGAKEVAMEFHSLSKTFNMTGWRVAMAVGNPEMVQALFRIKSNLDSGVPQAIQYAAIAALKGPREVIEGRNRVYQRRRDKLLATLHKIGLWAEPPRAGLYIWARVPPGYTSARFATMLLEEKGIVVTPGSAYGEHGEGYIRLSLTVPDADLEKALARLEGWQVPPPGEVA